MLEGENRWRQSNPMIGAETDPAAKAATSLIKRGLDVICASLAVLALAPLGILVATAIACTMGRPVLFRQRRPGLNGRTFEMIKFRTMRNAIDSTGRPLPDEARITRLGGILRQLSIDELPELLNVLRGEMSLVGPRPLLTEYLPRYSAEQARRHQVRPGVTGWAQVNGRNAIDWDTKLALDVWYVDHWSVWLDIRILSMTISKVLKREGIRAEGYATASEFTGSVDRKSSG
jgi:lipopolysaccharide/colanic/teichoic acid biosynthesis glycosyltransferase